MKPHLPAPIELLESRIVLAGDFLIEILRVNLPGTTVLPGESGSVVFRVTNGGDAPLAGLTGLHLYMSTDSTLGGLDPLIGRVQNVHFNLGAGKSKTFTGNIKLVAATLPSPSFPVGPFKVLAEADSGHRISESNEFNNVAASSTTFNYALKFGTFDDRRNAVLHVKDGDGTAASFSVRGAGAGQLLPGGGKVDFYATGTDERSVLRMTASGGDGALQLDDFVFGDLIRELDMPSANVSGSFALPASTRSVTVNDVFASISNRTIGILSGDTPAVPSEWKFGTVTDRSFYIRGGAGSITADAWLSVDATTETMVAAYISDLNIKNNFAPNLRLDGSSVPAGKDLGGRTLGTAKIGGEILGAIWRIGNPAIPDESGAVAKIVAERTPVNWDFDASGLVKNLTIPTLRGTIDALAFDRVVVETSLSATLRASDANSQGHALVRLIAGDVAGANISTPEGGILEISVASWTGGGKIEALFVHELNSRTNGDFSANVDLAIAGKTPANLPPFVRHSLTKANIKGSITGGTWETMTDVSSIKVGGATNWTLNVPGRVSFIESNADLRGHLTAWTFHSIEARGEIGGTITSNMPDPDGQLGIVSLQGGAVSGLNVLVPATAGITQVRAKSWIGGGIDTGWLRLLTIGAKAAGDFDANVTLHRGQPPLFFGADGNGLTLAKIAGTFTGAITAPDTVALGELRMGAVNNGTIDASQADEISVKGDFTGTIQLRATTGGLPDFSVGGALTNSTVNVGDDIRRTEIGSMMNSTITTAGRLRAFSVEGTLTGSAVQAAESAAGPFKFNPTYIVGGMVNSSFDIAGPVKRFEVHEGGGAVFRGSNVSAGEFSKVILRGLDPANGGIPFGISADYIDLYQRFVGTGSVKLTDLEDPGTYGVVDDFRVLII